MPARIKRDDVVVITAGKDKGQQGRVLKVLVDEDRVLVEGINKVTHHKKANPQNPSEGGRVVREAPIHMSNVMPWSEKDKKGVRVRFQEENGKLARFSAASGAKITASAPAVTDEKASKKKGDQKE